MLKHSENSHEEREKLQLYWITDIHLLDKVTGLPDAVGAISGNRHYYAAKHKLQQAVSIIEQEQPDWVICTGDMIDNKQSLASFNEEWTKIQAPKEIMIGNHDLDNGYAALVQELGYSERPTIAGSKFNRSFPIHKGHIQVRLLLVDMNIGEDGEHRSGTAEGLLQDDAFEWIEHELIQSPEQIVMIFSHNGIGGPTRYFNQQHVQRFLEMTERVIKQKEGMKIIHCAGHHHVHPTAEVMELAPNFTFINGVAMISESYSYINVISIQDDGSFELTYRQVGYPSEQEQERKQDTHKTAKQNGGKK